MKDPQPAPAGTPGEDPAAHTATVSIADYQFGSRKARRIAERTGMIPVVAPAEITSAQPREAVVQQDALHGPQSEENKPEDSKYALKPSPVLSPVFAEHTQKNGQEVPGPVSAAAHADSVSKNVAEPAQHLSTSQDLQALSSPHTAQADVEELVSTSSSATTSDTSNKHHWAAAPSVTTRVPAVPVPVAPDTPNLMDGLPEMMAAEKPKRTPKAGRDLPAAISVGIVLFILVMGTMLFFPLAFVVAASIFCALGVWEVCRAIAGKGIQVPVTPVMVGALSMPASAYFGGSEGLLFALVASCGATLLWRSLDSSNGAVKSILAGVFTLLWVPFLLSFIFLMIRGDNGPVYGLTLDLLHINRGVLEVVVMLSLVIANDTFGYLVGVLFGKHPMAPKISPKKSWEGFAGSMGGAMLVGVTLTVYVLHDHWWIGVALAVGMVLAGTGGDFAESMIKRELGIKDMSNLLPGHGGVMDRLDSILFAAPVAYATFAVLGRF